MKNFMCNVSVVSDIPPSSESILKRGDEGVHKRLKSINQEFGNDFVYNIEKTNKPKMVDIIRKRSFWFESNVSMVKGFKQTT